MTIHTPTSATTAETLYPTVGRPSATPHLKEQS